MHLVRSGNRKIIDDMIQSAEIFFSLLHCLVDHLTVKLVPVSFGGTYPVPYRKVSAIWSLKMQKEDCDGESKNWK